MKRTAGIALSLARATLLVALVVASWFWSLGQLENAADARKHSFSPLLRFTLCGMSVLVIVRDIMARKGEGGSSPGLDPKLAVQAPGPPQGATACPGK